MPNYCYNQLTITGEPKMLNKMLKQIEVTKTEETEFVEASKFSFHKVIPMPIEEKDNWYEWRIANWGTKWSSAIDYDTIDSWENGEVFIEFRTAWSPPIPILLELSKQNPKLDFSWKCYEESHEFWANGEAKKGEWVEYYEGEFNTCAEYNEFGLSHHVCKVCENYCDECDNSDTNEIDICAECKANLDEVEAEVNKQEQELWG